MLEETNSITFLNLSGDITITWDSENDEKIKALVQKKMAEGYSFFTMRKVVIEAVKYKSRVGAKGVDKINNLIIDDATFDKMVAGMDDRDVAALIVEGSGHLGKRAKSKEPLEAVKRMRSVDEVIKNKQSLCLRPIHGG